VDWTGPERSGLLSGFHNGVDWRGQEGRGVDWKEEERTAMDWIGPLSGIHNGEEWNGRDGIGVDRNGKAFVCFNLGREHERYD
jgi:hypothetical protein